jgi:hypothetical protein
MPGQLMSPALSPQALMNLAVKRTGLDDFGGSDFREPLEILVQSLQDTGDLHPFGRFYVNAMFTELLINRLKLVDLWKRQPDISGEPIGQPVIILGLPRTGTSFLFNLLALDPAHRVLTNWETTVSQVPPEGAYGFRQDPRRKKGRFLMRFQNYLVPQMKKMHQFYLDGPEECTPLLMQGFATQALAGLFNVPDYSGWLDTASHAATYRHHRRILQTLQWKYPGERWLLKSPDHIAALADILETYPDACIVHTYRDPVKSVASWASLNSAFRGIYMQSINVAELGRQVLDRLSSDVRAYLEQRQDIEKNRIIDLSYERLSGNPLEAIHGLYEQFGLVMSAAAEARIHAFLAQDRKTRRSHQYSPGDFGLTARSIQERFQEYIDRFNIEREL